MKYEAVEVLTSATGTGGSCHVAFWATALWITGSVAEVLQVGVLQGV